MKSEKLFCIKESVFGPALTRGNAYVVIERDVDRRQVLVRGDNGRERWFPDECFSLENDDMVGLLSFSITNRATEYDDEFIEVSVSFSNGSTRTCMFATPRALEVAGDTLGDTGVRIHYDLGHLVVMSRLSRELIERALMDIDAQGLLWKCTTGG